MSDQEQNKVVEAVELLKSLVKQLCDAGMPPHAVDKMTAAMTVVEEAANRSLMIPSVEMSSVALKKARELVASGFSVCGFTLEKDGNSSAVMFDSAVRWLSPEDRRVLMFTAGSKVTVPEASDVEQLPEGGMSDEALEALVARLEAAATAAGGGVRTGDLMRLARQVRALVYKAGPVAGVKRARLMVSRVHRLLQDAEAQGFGKVTVALVRKTMAPYLPLSDREFSAAVAPSLLNAAQAVVEAERGDYLSSALIAQLQLQCESAMTSRNMAVEALSSDDVKALLECAMAMDGQSNQQLMISTAEKIVNATGDEYGGRLVESVRKAIGFNLASGNAVEHQGAHLVPEAP